MCRPLAATPAVGVISNELISQIALLIHKGSFDLNNLPADLVNAIYDYLLSGIQIAFVPNSDLLPSQFDLLKNIENNLFVFSEAKTKTQLVEYKALLYDANGNLRPFRAFLTDVKMVHKTYNEVYLAAEYNHAVASSQMAFNWAELTTPEAVEAMPYLMYDTAGDDSVRPEHVLLNNVIKHKNDAFWNTFYPPNGWNCRCSVIEYNTNNGNDLEALTVELPDMFKTNVGKTGTLFPNTHPYFNNLNE